MLVSMLAVFAGALAGTALVRRLARRYGWMAFPRDDRWHKRPVPLHGGIGFVPPLLLAGVGLLVTMPGGQDAAGAAPARLVAALLAGQALMFVLGWLDDLYHLRPSVKLIVQTAAAALFVATGGLFHLGDWDALNIAVTLIWLVGITNALNMLDNMDGLSSSVAAIASGTLTVMAAMAGGTGDAPLPGGLLAAILCSSALAFWSLNRSPATIYMGDSGSLVLGYGLAALSLPSALNGWWGGAAAPAQDPLAPYLALMIPFCLLIVPVLDLTFVSMMRLRMGRPIMLGGRDHTSHQLCLQGLTEPQAVSLLNGLGLLGGLLAVALMREPWASLPLAAITTAAVLGWGLALAGTGLDVSVLLTQQPPWRRWLARIAPQVYRLIFPLDMGLAAASFVIVVFPPYAGQVPSREMIWLPEMLPLVSILALAATKASGVYRLRWGHLSSIEAVRYGAAASLAGATLFATARLVMPAEQQLSLLAFVAFAIIYGSLLLLSRGALAIFRDVLRYQRGKTFRRAEAATLLIYGAGKGGRWLLGHIHDRNGDYHLLGFVDDNPQLEGASYGGYPIKSPQTWAKESVSPVREIWVSSDSIPMARVQALVLLLLRGDTPAGPPLIRRLAWGLEPVEPSAASLRQVEPVR